MNRPQNLTWGYVTSDDISVAVGKRIALRRRELGLSLAQMAERCGVSLQQIHKYETGQSAVSAPMLVKLAACLDVSPSYFFHDVELKS